MSTPKDPARVVLTVDVTGESDADYSHEVPGGLTTDDYALLAKGLLYDAGWSEVEHTWGVAQPSETKVVRREWPASYSTRAAIAEAGLDTTLSAADAIREAVSERDELRELLAERTEADSKFLKLLNSVETQRDQALVEIKAASEALSVAEIEKYRSLADGIRELAARVREQLLLSAEWVAMRDQRAREYDLAVVYYEALERCGDDAVETLAAREAMREVTDKMSDNQAFIAYLDRKQTIWEYRTEQLNLQRQRADQAVMRAEAAEARFAELQSKLTSEKPEVDRSAMTSKQIVEEWSADPVNGWRVVGYDSGSVQVDLSNPDARSVAVFDDLDTLRNVDADLGVDVEPEAWPTDTDYLSELAERLMQIPTMYGTDQGDAEHLREIAARVKSGKSSEVGR